LPCDKLILGVDLSDHPLDAPMPRVAPSATRANPERRLEYSRNGEMTLRQAALRATAAKADWVIKGTPKDIADHIDEWFINTAADGFNLLPPCVPNSLTEFVDLVLPELRHRGLFPDRVRG
jgi:alkanesulfonate monooxygenase SsuD/methylene tetrahydromethanopterin reductase-like flavin-dependent oxidoreductase (luciferase family)